MSLSLRKIRYALLAAVIFVCTLAAYIYAGFHSRPSPIGSILSNYFETNEKRLIHKWLHYFEIYEKHLERFRNTDVVILEIGVSHGGSLQMWKEYFGPKARIIGVDIDQRCKSLEESQIEIWIGDQSDRAFWKRFNTEVPRVDIVVDDGGHLMQQQITTFEELYPKLSENGVYICEDTHTSYLGSYGGGYRRPGTFIEMAKGLVDQLTAWHSGGPAQFHVNDFTRSTYSMTFYDAVVVMEKRPRVAPKAEKRGKVSF